MLDKAIRIAATAHEGQTDKAGQPYILHPLRVMFMLRKETEKICAVLHDVFEDTDITIEYLRKEGFSEEVLIALNALTRRENESYDDFIGRVIENKTACKVKLADLSDNMDLSRISNPTREDYNRIEKYRKATDRILACVDSEEDHE
ncbi:MAG TPA: GTP pyrophosphokinase [Acetivibrio sp.]|jgi:(p)ppGpp synthase/HD superfamily hydrolase|nr:GTP pyrophosphokinase [Clostridium sp.]HOQ36958.1 GTP pyrophosphokinase [Acetivibrio sp.]HPT91249.1 GTP pyrophosphokinase [Acetivibrio sp.]